VHARGVTGVKSLEQLAASDPFHRAHGEPAAGPRERRTRRSSDPVVLRLVIRGEAPVRVVKASKAS